MKSEPEVYSIADLQQQRETIWDGVVSGKLGQRTEDGFQVIDESDSYWEYSQPILPL